MCFARISIFLESRAMSEYTIYTKMLIGLLAIVNPIGAIPIILSITNQATLAERKRISKTVVISVALILLIALFLGEQVLHFFGISIDSFRVGGGILILIMSISMMKGHLSEAKQTKEEAEEGEMLSSVAVVPLSMPLLAGPGAISTVILYSHQSHTLQHKLIITFEIFVLSTILWIVFLSIPWISRHISRTGINVFTRIMGLILAAISIEFISEGVKGLFPTLF